MYYWCNTCSAFCLNKQDSHLDHDILIFGKCYEDTLSALDQMIDHGVSTLERVEKEVDTTTKAKQKILLDRRQYVKNFKRHIEQVWKDLKRAMEDAASEIEMATEEAVQKIEQEVDLELQQAPMKLDTAKEFIERSAMMIPDDDGKVDDGKVRELFVNFENLRMKCKTSLIKSGDDIDFPQLKFPNSMNRKVECEKLAKQVCGEIITKEDPFAAPMHPGLGTRSFSCMGRIAMMKRKKIDLCR